MTSSHKLGLAVALLSLAMGGLGCAADDELDADGTSQDVIATIKNYAPEKATDRINSHYLPKSLYQGTTPEGDACTMTVSRDSASHLVAVSMGVFRKTGLERTGFEVSSDTTVSNWTDRTIGLDFDVAFDDEAGKDANAHVTFLAPKRQTTSLKIQFGDRAFECAKLEAPRAPMR